MAGNPEDNLEVEIDRESLRQACRQYRLRGLDDLLEELD
jgi:hypothetical protein